MESSMYFEPMTPKESSISGRQSAFAPASTRRNLDFGVGIMVAIAGRFTPLMRLVIKVPPTAMAPVLPADTKAFALSLGKGAKSHGKGGVGIFL